jgi:shikimate dehydrogenase (EC 1.1.1.25)
MTEQYAVIGHPLGHTLSPLLHNWGFEHRRVDARYAALPVTPGELDGFMERVRDGAFAGLSVTIPHKRAVMAHLDGLTPRAEAVGAVNTVFWRDGLLLGENTDVLGIVEPLRGLGPFRRGLVLGAGGAARAAVAALKELGLGGIFVANRTRDKAEALAREFGATAAPWESRTTLGADLLVNTTPLGMSGERVGECPWPGETPIPSDLTVFDLVYNPLETILLRRAEDAGCRTISGLEMFVHQGLAQFKLWTGLDLDPDQARTLLLNVLQAP